MNILHMSDLHLGRRFYNLSFLPIQQALLQEVLQIIDDQQVTVLLLCGDIYDTRAAGGCRAAAGLVFDAAGSTKRTRLHD